MTLDTTMNKRLADIFIDLAYEESAPVNIVASRPGRDSCGYPQVDVTLEMNESDEPSIASLLNKAVRIVCSC